MTAIILMNCLYLVLTRFADLGTLSINCELVCWTVSGGCSLRDIHLQGGVLLKSKTSVIENVGTNCFKISFSLVMKKIARKGSAQLRHPKMTILIQD